ncbi:hypothetical protein TUE45_pSRTUE45a_0057 (plasmid) [Streptomyces reticuli]|nr:hypothetical protein TUE45_pSRTUE45a_0057 [Streptomyces reticuli]
MTRTRATRDYPAQSHDASPETRSRVPAGRGKIAGWPNLCDMTVNITGPRPQWPARAP